MKKLAFFFQHMALGCRECTEGIFRMADVSVSKWRAKFVKFVLKSAVAGSLIYITVNVTNSMWITPSYSIRHRDNRMFVHKHFEEKSGGIYIDDHKIFLAKTPLLFILLEVIFSYKNSCHSAY